MAANSRPEMGRRNSKFFSVSLALLLTASLFIRTAAGEELTGPPDKDATSCNNDNNNNNQNKLNNIFVFTSDSDPDTADMKNPITGSVRGLKKIMATLGVNNETNHNPQQKTGTEQVLDRDTYDGRMPDAKYPTHPAYGYDDYDELNPPGPTADVDEDMQELAESMTLRELAGQMTQIQIGMLLDERGELDMQKVQYWVGEWGVGSFLDTPTNHGGRYISYSAKKFSKIVDAIQEVSLSTGKGVPMIYGLDSVHGANYVDGSVLFPQQIGLAATFNTVLAYETGRITAKDTRAAGIPWVFAPILDIAVHKLWPRVYETFGEDPHVAAEMGSAVIKGLQGNYKKDRTRVAACMKHFIGYSASHNGQDKSSAWIPDNYLMDYFVPSFQAAVDAGVATAMETYIDVNGQSVVSSHFYLTELLRHRLGFQGMLVTDWQELDRLHTEHRNAPSLNDATLQCLKQTTVDMVMVPESESFSVNAAELVKEGKLSRKRLVESTAKILQLKKDLGLFEKPMSDRELLSYVGSKQDVEAAKLAARESVTVLKNGNNVLPLHSAGEKIVVTGPAANSIRALSGGWSIKWQGASDDSWYEDRGETILQGLQKEFGADAVSYKPSVNFDGNSGDLGAFLESIKNANTVILCLGEAPYAEIVGNINNLDLPWEQLDLIRKVNTQVRGTGTKVILVLVEGRPRGLQDTVGLVDAVVMAYLPGPWGGHPIAEVLSGAVNPSGRLPMTYPSGASDMTTNYYRSGVDPYSPLFPFSAGLSYVKVEYRGLKLNKDVLHTRTYSDGDDDEDEEDDGDEDHDGSKFSNRVKGHRKYKSFKVGANSEGSHTIMAKIIIKNKGDRSVKETVFWYITQDYRSDVMPEAFLLKGFQKVELGPGESKEVHFKVTRAALAYHDRELRKKVEKGKFTLTVNAMRPEAQSVKFDVL